MVTLFGMTNSLLHIMRSVKHPEKKCVIWQHGSVSTALPQLFKFNEAATLLLHILSEQPPWCVFENLNVSGNHVTAISLESLCALFSEEICCFYMLMVLKLVICSIFIAKQGQCVISCLPSFSPNIQDTLSQFISHAVYCLVITCLKSQGNVLSKSLPILRDCSQNSKSKNLTQRGKLLDKPLLLFFPISVTNQLVSPIP